MAMIDEWQRVGLMVTAFGLFFLFFGVVMMFDRALLAFGNLLFVTGVALVIGVQKTISFFFQARKIKGTTCFLGGILVVLLGWTIIGMLIEVFGFINLFGYVLITKKSKGNKILTYMMNIRDFFPIVFTTLRRVPVIGPILDLPIFRAMTDSYDARLPV